MLRTTMDRPPSPPGEPERDRPRTGHPESVGRCERQNHPEGPVKVDPPTHKRSPATPEDSTLTGPSGWFQRHAPTDGLRMTDNPGAGLPVTLPKPLPRDLG